MTSTRHLGSSILVCLKVACFNLVETGHLLQIAVPKNTIVILNCVLKKKNDNVRHLKGLNCMRVCVCLKSVNAH